MVRLDAARRCWHKPWPRSRDSGSLPSRAPSCTENTWAKLRRPLQTSSEGAFAASMVGCLYCGVTLDSGCQTGHPVHKRRLGAEHAHICIPCRAQSVQPAVIFFDELDGLAGTRSSGDGEAGVGDRVISQLLQELDGISSRQGVVVIAATNRLDCLDPALLRPGRFDRLVKVPLPDLAARTAILKVQTRKMPLAADVDLSAIAEATTGLSGADLANLCQVAALATLDESFDSVAVCQRHFDSALASVM